MGDATTAAIFFADRLSRMRRLAPEETEMLVLLMSRVAPTQPLRRWTRAEDAELNTLLREGMTAVEIAQAIGRSRGAVHTRVKRLKIKEIAHGARRTR